MEFANLHNHTDKGSFDSIMTSKRFISRIKELGQQYVVQTDHGTMRGMVEVAKEAYKNDLKYIPGVEVYITHQSCVKAKDEFGKAYYHMLLLAKNNEGLKNLFRLVYMSTGKDRFYYKPRISLDDLFNHKEGIIATSGCLASLTSQTIIAEAKGVENMLCAQKLSLGYKHICDDTCDVPLDAPYDPNLIGCRSIDTLINRFTDNFGEDFYLELQDSGAGPEQELVNNALIDISKRRGIPLIVTADAHYASPEEAKLKTLVMKVRHGQSLKEDGESIYGEMKTHLKSAEELIDMFGTEPLSNTVLLANKCNVTIPFDQTFFPVPSLPEKKTSRQFLRELSYQKLKEYGLNQEKVYVERLEEELQTIGDLGFADYFLVLLEILTEARKRGIGIGAGRGSAAGSLVCYLLWITEVDPISYKLFFSRFLNKARVSFPDIDIDIPKHRRAEFLHMVTEMYGNEKVCQIMTFMQMKPKGSARDIGRILSEQKLGEQVADLIPPPLHGVEVTVSEALEQEPRLLDSKYAPIVDRMKILEGLNRQTGIHAGGMVISPVPLTELIPVELQGKEKDRTVAQLAMEEIEAVGLVKMDFLGLRNLEVIERCISLIDGMDSPKDIPFDDEETFADLRTTSDFGGIFQLEGSAGMSELAKRLQVHSINDISHVTALYRPGPLGIGLDKTLVERKRNGYDGSKDLLYSITKDTYGCLIYQEQLIQVCVDIAGLSPEDGDRIRKVLGKKKVEEVEKWKEPFVKGCKVTSGLDRQTALGLFANIETGSSYLFNRSHAVFSIKSTTYENRKG